MKDQPRRKLVLIPETHQYVFDDDGSACSISATGIISKYHEDFNVEDALRKKAERDMRYLPPEEGGNVVLREYTKMEWDMSKMWGTLFHYFLELYVEGKLTYEMFAEAGKKAPADVVNAIKQVKKIDRDKWDIIPEYTTYLKYKGNYIGCQFDLLLVNKENPNIISIWDYKFTKTLDNKAYNKKFYPPLDKLACSKQNKYFLQNSIYMLALEQERPGVEFYKNRILHSAPEKENSFTGATVPPVCKVIECKDLRPQAKQLIEHYFSS